MFDSYVRVGRVDLSVRRRGGGGPQPTVSGFAALDAAWEAEMDRRGLAPATRAAYGRVARSYLVFLQGRGITDLDTADGGSVLAFLESLLDRWAKSSLFWVVSNFRPFLTFTDRPDLVDAANLAGVKRSHAIISVLDDEDERRVVRACASGVVTARDAAITLLALTTGLRACDIVGLRLGDIDWRAGTIGIVQQKTGNPLTLPLPALLVGRLADYLLGERSGSVDDHVFLRSVAPHTRLADHATVYRVNGGDVPQGRSDRREGRNPVPAPRRRIPAAGRGGPATDDLGRPRPRQPGIDQPVHEHRPCASARMRPAGSRRRPSMSGHRGFTSAFAAELDAYVTFKQNMGFTGASRVWYLRRFDAYCSKAGRVRPGHRRGLGDQPTRTVRPLPVLDVLHPRPRPVAADERRRRRLRAVRPLESRVRARAPVPAHPT